MEHVFLGLGSNLGRREDFLEAAIEALRKGVTIDRVSSLYQTKPWGYKQQPDFLNQALQAQTDLTPRELLNLAKEIEATMGRTATFKFGPRTIDIDILFFGERVLDEVGLSIPHPHIDDRAFVLVPMAEIAPDLIHPISRRTIKDLTDDIDISGVRKYSPGD